MKAVIPTGCAALVLAFCGSCSHHPTQVGSPRPLPIWTPPEMKMADMDSPTLSVTIPEINLWMLDLDEFLPPGSQLIQPRPAVSVVTVVVPKVRYPSTAETAAPNGDATVGTISHGPARLMHHSLLLFRPGDDAASPIFTTTKSFDLMWAPNSLVFDISHLTGKNGPQVLIGNIRDRASLAAVATGEAVAVSPPVTSICLMPSAPTSGRKARSSSFARSVVSRRLSSAILATRCWSIPNSPRTRNA